MVISEPVVERKKAPKKKPGLHRKAARTKVARQGVTEGGRGDGGKNKAVTFRIPQRLFNGLSEWAHLEGVSMTHLFRWSIGVAKTIWDLEREGASIYFEHPDDPPGTRTRVNFHF